MKKEPVSFSDFQKLDLRVGKVLEAELVANSHYLFRLTVDFGQDYGTVKILAGLGRWYQPQDLKGKNFLFVANLAPKEIRGELSAGMILCADLGREAKIIPVAEDLPAGTLIR